MNVFLAEFEIAKEVAESNRKLYLKFTGLMDKADKDRDLFEKDLVFFGAKFQTHKGNLASFKTVYKALTTRHQEIRQELGLGVEVIDESGEDSVETVASVETMPEEGPAPTVDSEISSGDEEG